MTRLWAGVWIVLLVWSCSSPERTGPEVSFTVPANFPKPLYAFERNPLTTSGVELGKALFNETLLSKDNTISCAECHSQPYGFTHHGHDVSHGINNLKGTRNSLPLQNLAWESEFFWDGGVPDLDFVPIAPIISEVEMGETMANVLDKLRATKKYPLLFRKAYGTEEITTTRFLQALSQFMLTMVSANSRYDHFVRKEGVTLTNDEQTGLHLFQQKCSSCHAGELFTDRSYRNNGLFLTSDADEGRFRITNQEKDRYTFRVPSLRNVAVTGPYMHDGRFYTLEAVLDHYAENVHNTPNLDPILKASTGKRGIALTQQERQQIIAFLKTLTDEEFLTNKQLAVP
ncbi:cytochrome-c peroxidase [Siphonobacter sp. BAB-5385]|uniref:cytochrome-c peroxidase n=1 Tax=Siphonobacter sp. BAB-5385 TaxID=1864822 RepID=UPI000B9E230D|nr:cytochrome c peroxidase [Siphonobacter sp. BAB-5385]OZI08172.1 cytochrome-c peroxidase [Siphonobacter sp. BAB-5385]